MPGLLPLLLPLLLASPQTTKLNPPLAVGPAGGDARGLAGSPDGRWVVYLADQDQIGEVNLYCVPAAGGAPTRLSAAGDVASMEVNASSTHAAYTRARVSGEVGTGLFLATLPRLGPGGRARSAFSPPGVRLSTNARGRFSPDGRWFVYEDYEPEVAELRLVSVERAGASTLIDSTDYVFWDAQLSPDSRWLVYERSACPNCTRELVVADLLGGGLRVLATGTVRGITADSSRVVYSVAGRVEVAPLDGSTAPMDLGLALTSDETILHLELDPTDTRVVVATGRRAPGGFSFLPDKILSAPLDGSAAPVELTPDFAVLANAPAFELSPDGARVVYSTNIGWDFTLFEVAIGGGSAMQIAEGDVRDFGISPDSSAVVYILGAELRAKFFAGADVALGGSLVQGGAVTSFQFSPDAQHVVYRADRDADDVFELYRVALVGGASTRLNAPLPAGGDIYGGLVTSDSARVAYIGGQNVAGEQEVYSVPILGGTPIQLSRAFDPGPPTGDVLSQQITADGGRVVYHADGDADEVYELYSTPVAGGDVRKLNGPLVTDGDVQAWGLGAGSRVVYMATQELASKLELFSVPSDGGAPPVKLNHELPNFGFMRRLREYVLSPSGEHVAYRITGGTGIVALHANRVDGTTSPTPISLPGHSLEFSTAVGTRFEFAFDASDLRLYYRQGPDLYSVPRAGGTAQKLNQTFAGSGSLGYPYFTPGISSDEPKTFEAAPDGQRVVFTADESGQALYQLFSVPSDGSAAPVLVSGPITTGGDVVRFEITEDRVVYYADAEVDQRFELFSAPLDASAPAVRLSLPFATNGAVTVPTPIAFAPGGAHVLFVQGGELYRVAVDGATAPMEIGSNALASRIVAQGDHVLYTTVDGTGLFGVPLDGSASPVQLNVPLVIDDEVVSSVLSRGISPDGNWAIYLSNERELGVNELFARRIDGSGSRILLSGTLQPDGDVTAEILLNMGSRLTVGPTHVVYRADQDTDEVTEIYSSPLPAFP